MNVTQVVRSKELVFYVILFVWVTYLLYEITTWSGMDDWLIPVVFTVPLYLLIIIQILMVLDVPLVQRLSAGDSELSVEDLVDGGDVSDRPNREEQSVQENSRTEADGVASSSQRSVYGIVGFVVAGVVAIYLVGFFLALPLFVFLFVLYLEDLKGAIVSTMIFSVFVYLLFIVILDVFLWPGILP